MPSTGPLFHGVGVALVTLFDEDGRLLLEETVEHAARLVERGVAAVLVAGSTGEAWFLTAEERVQLCAAAREALGDRVPIIVGTGNPEPTEAARQTVGAREAGADAALALSPPDREDHRAYYAAVAEAAGEMPVLGYHFPQISAPGIPVEQLAELPIAGVKDSSGDAERLVAELDAYAGPVYVGSSALLAIAGPLGAPGAILALANTDPEPCIAAFAGDLEAQKALLPAHREAGIDFPAGLKRRLGRASGVSTAVRRGLPAAR
jgi:4-hydroxy-tetrahydrodipicolinate synthase